MRKYILLFVLACLHLGARGQTSDLKDITDAIKDQATTAKTMMYWSDEDYGNAKTLEGSLTGHDAIAVASFGDGLPTFHFLLIDLPD